MKYRLPLNPQKPISFGQRVRALRLERGWSQQRLADAVGKSRQTIRYVEAGKRGATAAFRERLAEVLKVDPGELGAPRARREPDWRSKRIARVRLLRLLPIYRAWSWRFDYMTFVHDAITWVEANSFRRFERAMVESFSGNEHPGAGSDGRGPDFGVIRIRGETAAILAMAGERVAARRVLDQVRPMAKHGHHATLAREFLVAATIFMDRGDFEEASRFAEGGLVEFASIAEMVRIADEKSRLGAVTLDDLWTWIDLLIVQVASLHRRHKEVEARASARTAVQALNLLRKGWTDLWARNLPASGDYWPLHCLALESRDPHGWGEYKVKHDATGVWQGLDEYPFRQEIRQRLLALAVDVSGLRRLEDHVEWDLGLEQSPERAAAWLIDFARVSWKRYRNGDNAVLYLLNAEALWPDAVYHGWAAGELVDELERAAVDWEPFKVLVKRIESES